MIPIIIGAAVAVGGAVFGAYKYFKEPSTKPNPKPSPRQIGTFAVWGRPDVGKTTFINFLLSKKISGEKKEATTHRAVYQDTKISVSDRAFIIKQIIDMPGTVDRMKDWLEQAGASDHVFYIVDVSRTETSYINQVYHDLKETVSVISDKQGCGKNKIHIIATHIDVSRFKDLDHAHIHNVLQQDDAFRKIYETVGGVAGYVYAANLTDSNSRVQLLRSIVGDCCHE